MPDLAALQQVLDAVLVSQQVSALMVGTGFLYDWYEDRFEAIGREVVGPDRLRLAAECQSANEVALTILDRRVRLTTQTDVSQRPPGDILQLLHVRSFLGDSFQGPPGSDCKALIIATQLGWQTVVLAKRREDLPKAGRLRLPTVREAYPGLIDRGFEEVWPDRVRVFVWPTSAVNGSREVLEASFEVTK